MGTSRSTHTEPPGEEPPEELVCEAPRILRVAPGGRNGAMQRTVVIFPAGGGYRKVEMGKEGVAVAQLFAISSATTSYGVDYALAPPSPLRAGTIAPSLTDAVAALQ